MVLIIPDDATITLLLLFSLASIASVGRSIWSIPQWPFGNRVAAHIKAYARKKFEPGLATNGTVITERMWARCVWNGGFLGVELTM